MSIDLVNKPNCYTVIQAGGNPFILEALGDRLIIEEDPFKTGYECKTCGGEGYINEPCTMCVGRNMPEGYEDTNGTPCRFCHAVGRGSQELRHGYGKKTCEACKGIGATVVITQESVRRPTSGVIMSVGPDVKGCPECFGQGSYINTEIKEQTVDHTIDSDDRPEKPNVIPVMPNEDSLCPRCLGSGTLLRVGMRVIYAIFAGTAITFKTKGTCRILHENEIMGIIYGTANLGEIVK